MVSVEGGSRGVGLRCRGKAPGEGPLGAEEDEEGRGQWSRPAGPGWWLVCSWTHIGALSRPDRLTLTRKQGSPTWRQLPPPTCPAVSWPRAAAQSTTHWVA